MSSGSLLESTQKNFLGKINLMIDMFFQSNKKGAFESTLMDTTIGYYIYIPDAYHEQLDKDLELFYYLHGGRPGNEAREAFISSYIHNIFQDATIDPAIYIFVNGGELSHYNSDELNSYGDILINELIPHIDRKYRTINDRQGRGLEGFSQGGRAVTRLCSSIQIFWNSISWRRFLCYRKEDQR